MKQPWGLRVSGNGHGSSKISFPHKFPSVGFYQIGKIWSGGNNPPRIEGKEIAVVVSFNAIEIARVGYTGKLVQIPQVPPQMLVILNAATIAFEESIIDDIEPEQGGKQSHVRQGNAIAT